MVLAVAQALAGGNNTVIVVHRRIVGAMLAPDKGLATLPITGHGGWHVVRHAAGRRARPPFRPALRAADRLGVRHAVRADLLFGGDQRPVLAAAGRHLLRRALCRGAQVLPFCRRRHGERGIPAQGGVLGAGRRRIRRGHRAAAGDLHQGSAAALSVRGQLSRAIRLRGRGGGGADVRENAAAAGKARRQCAPARRDRAQPPLHRRGRLRRSRAMP